MQKRRLRHVSRLFLLRLLLTCALGAIALAALLAAHVFPSSKIQLPKQLQYDIGHQRWSGEQSWMWEFSPPSLSKISPQSWKLLKNHEVTSLLIPTVGLTRCGPGIKRISSYYIELKGSIIFVCQICDMVAVARIINATLVIPELDKQSFWQDPSNFSDVFDVEHFISTLANDVKVIKRVPNELVADTKALKHFRSWSGVEYYQEEIAQMWDDYKVIHAAKSDSRVANNNLPPDIQKLRCRAFYDALRFAPPIEALGKLLVKRMRSYGPYIALHLRYEKDMLAFSGCTHGLSASEAEELTKIREKTAHWKVKDIDPLDQRAKGYCPLTPKEVGIFLIALGYPSTTPIFIAAGDIYGGDSRMVDLESRFPILMSKEKLASVDELEPFVCHASQMAALDYIVSVESDVFIPSYSGNMARAVEEKPLSVYIIKLTEVCLKKAKSYHLWWQTSIERGKGPRGRGKGQFLEQEGWIGSDQKKHSMRILYQTVYVRRKCLKGTCGR
ncbi:GDP-fucose protein O-fucosyltransferase [Cinnamomum micranthum f. kanehirae]|uniref:O-fucosyltransferase family protein n=1 Tax=Cinnamomum micranthum f. kanehirae TaxID=337451 RepID=A0A443PGP1_9MAGN|nr:GDP-fucose protein O-fucosyltransferase [Cinnamomum micranthum f. kanehirae]